LSSTNTTFRALAKLMLLGALAFAPTTSRAQDPISSLTRFVNYRNPLYNYQSRPALDPAYNLPARTNPAQPVVGPYTITPGIMTLCCHRYSSRPASLNESYSLTAPKGYLKLYPNPTNGQYLNIVYQMENHSLATVELYDITGRLIDLVEMPFTDNTQECHFTFDIAKMNLPSGTYILKVKSQGEVYTEKFVNNK
jgi:hypothetical protein